MALMPAATAPMPAVKSAQCPPGHMVSGGFCAPLFRMPPAAVPKVMHCPNRLMQRGSSPCLEMRRRQFSSAGGTLAPMPSAVAWSGGDRRRTDEQAAWRLRVSA